MSRRSRACTFIALAVVLAGLAGPASASAQKSPLAKAMWGPTTLNGKSQFPIYRDLGVKIFQMQLSWDSIAPTPPAHPQNPRDPVYRWPSDIDFAIRQARANKMRILLMPMRTPSWANGGQSWQFAPTKMRAFADFLTAAARRYPSVHLWMIWGEPCRVGNWQPFEPQHAIGVPLSPAQASVPQRYARMVDASYGALKRRSRRNLVIGGNTFTSCDIRPARWIANMRLPNGKPPRMDLYGHNPFTLRAPDLSKPPAPDEDMDFSDLARLNRVVARYLGRPRHKTLRLFLSEWAVPTDGFDREFFFHVSRRLQASWIRDGFKVARQVNAYALGWVHLYDDPPNPGQRIGHSGLLTFDGKKKLGYFAFKRG